MGVAELKKLQARERAILDRYQVGTPPTVSTSAAPSPTEARSRYIATLRKGGNGIPGVSAQEAEAMANRRQWR